MKKRDVIIFSLLIVLVVVFTAWEKIAERRSETKIENARKAEREMLENRLSAYDLEFDSLTTSVLRLVDSLKTEAAAFESLAVARQVALELQVAVPQEEPAAQPEEVIEPRDTMQQTIQKEYEQAIASLPADLTRYEKKVAHKEVENTILAKFNLTLDEFSEMKKSWSAAP